MKKLVCILTVLLCLFSCAVPCFAADAADVTFTVKGEQPPKENVVINVYVSNDSSLYATDFYIIYAESDLKFIKKSVTAGEAASLLNPMITATEVAPGKVKISYASSNPIDISGSICRLEFRALRDTSAPVKLEIESAATYDGKHIRSLTTNVENTRISITKQPVDIALVAVFVAVLVVGIIVLIVVIKKKKDENSAKATDKTAKKKSGKK